MGSSKTPATGCGEHIEKLLKIWYVFFSDGQRSSQQVTVGGSSGAPRHPA
jgi:hypothetical protein